MFTKYHKEVKNRRLTLPSCLLVIYSFGIGLSLEIGFNITFALVTKPEKSSNCFIVSPYYLDDISYGYLVPTFQNIVLLLLYPVLGWFADVKIGRYRSVILSVWSCWFGTCLQLLSYCIQYGTCGLPVNIAKYGLSGLALIFIMFGTAAFLSNAFAFGMDQLCDGSSAQIRAFIHWMVWGLFLGFSTGYIAFVHDSITNPLLILVTGIITVFFLSMIVCINIVFKDKFIKSGVLKKNPYKMVFEVIKYAKQHKFPVKRSALTYWQNKSPSRIEFGKEVYGGPFKGEEVENVTSFLRICIVLLSMFGLYIPLHTVILGVFPYINKLEGSNTINGYGSYILWVSFDKIILVLVPLFELSIIPCFPKIEYFLLKPLRWIGVSHILLLLSLISMFVIDTVHDLQTSDDICLNSPTSSHNYYFLYYMIPFSLIGVVEILTFIYSLEFICSQAPANMNGMLIGIFWFIRASYINIGAIITSPFFTVPHVTGPGNLTCTFWPLLLQFLILVIGGAVYIMVTTKWYQRRQKGDAYDLQTTVESYYIRMMDIELKNNDAENDINIDEVTIID